MSLNKIETSLLGIEGHIKIWDPESGEVFVRRRNAVNYENMSVAIANLLACLLYTSPSPRDRQKSRMPSSA